MKKALLSANQDDPEETECTVELVRSKDFKTYSLNVKSTGPMNRELALEALLAAVEQMLDEDNENKPGYN